MRRTILPFCPNCGNEISDDDVYCSKCGLKVKQMQKSVKSTDKGKGKRIVASVLSGFMSGFFASWGLSLSGLSEIGFFLVFLFVTWFAYSKSKTPSHALSNGLYLMGIFVVLTPLMFYIPIITEATEIEGFAGLGYLMGGFMGIMMWGFVFLIFAVAIWILAYLVSRR